MSNGQDSIGTVRPGTKLWFVHLHTNQIEQLHISSAPKDERGNDLYEVRLRGKPRLMLVLWTRCDDMSYQVLLMTRNANRIHSDLVTVDKDSYVDCSRPYEYNDKALYEKPRPGRIPEEIDEEILDQVVSKLPLPMQREINRIRSHQALSANRSGHGRPGNGTT